MAIEAATQEMQLEPVLAALSDPIRMTIVRRLAREPEGCCCGDFNLPVAKSTSTHHFRVLREAGVIQTEERGRTKHNTLRREEFERRFPGLLEALLAAR